MSLSDTDVRASYDGDGVNDTFAIPAAEIDSFVAETQVWIRETSVTPVTETLKTIVTHYNIVGTNVVFTAGNIPTATQKVVITRVMNLTQLVSFLTALPKVNFPAIEKALDRVVAILQEHDDKFSRVPMLSITEQVAASPVLPDPVADTLIAWDSSALQLVLKTIADIGDFAFPGGNGLVAKTGALSSEARTIQGTSDEVDISNGDGVSGNPAVGISDSPIIPGTGRIKIPSGTTAQRPGTPVNADFRYNSTLGLFEGYKGFWSPVGSLGGSVLKTTTYTVTTDDDTVLCDTSGGAFTLTLPAAALSTGKKLIIKKVSSDVNDLTIDGNASETIDGATTTSLNGQYSFIEIICDGSNWHVISKTLSTQLALYSTRAGFGSTNTAIPYFSTSDRDETKGDSLLTVANDSTDGFSATAIRPCIVTMAFQTIYISTGEIFGVSRNGNSLTTNINLQTSDRILQFADDGGRGKSVSVESHLEIGDVIRPHCSAGSLGTASVWRVCVSAKSI